MSRIHLLEALLANQIAAGEVVERPASVIKELVENSLDAKAQHIRIDVWKGGHKRMQVRDDGVGIHVDDLSLALQRHATSKIQQVSDLHQVRSLGFRGEALASIAAVSRVKLTSRDHTAAQAYSVTCEEGQITSSQIAAHPQGTTVDVQDIFYSVPARRKFLRSEQTEYLQIRQIIERLSLGHFATAFSFYHNEKCVFDFAAALTPTEQRQRLSVLLGDDFAKAAIFIEHEQAGMRLWGWLADPSYTRSQPDLQHWIVNSRYIRDKLLNHAVRDAYHDVLFHGRYPAYALYLELDPADVDVNVHPSKQEVRFRENRLVHDFIKDAVSKVLVSIKPGVAVTTTPSVHYVPSFQRQAPMPLVIQEMTHFYSNSAVAPVHEMPVQAAPLQEYPLGHAIAQLHNIYILSQNKAGLMIVDMHAAHERILYEKMKKELAAENLNIQTLMLPITLTLNALEMEKWQSNQAIFNTVGLQTDALGADTIVIRSIPALLNGVDVAALVHDVLTDLTQHESSARLEEALHELLGTLACRAAVHAHRRLSLVEMDAILRDMERTQHTGHCNHGRPTWKQLTLAELDQFFLRGQ